LFALGALLSIGIVALLIVFSVNAQYQQTLASSALAESIALKPATIWRNCATICGHWPALCLVAAKFQ
jgi:hypothetical protein